MSFSRAKQNCWQYLANNFSCTHHVVLPQKLKSLAQFSNNQRPSEGTLSNKRTGKYRNIRTTKRGKNAHVPQISYTTHLSRQNNERVSSQAYQLKRKRATTSQPRPTCDNVFFFWANSKSAYNEIGASCIFFENVHFADLYHCFLYGNFVWILLYFCVLKIF